MWGCWARGERGAGERREGCGAAGREERGVRARGERGEGLLGERREGCGREERGVWGCWFLRWAARVREASLVRWHLVEAARGRASRCLGKMLQAEGTAGVKGLGQSTPAKSRTTREALPGARAGGGEGSMRPPAGLRETAGTEAFTLSEK